MLSLLLSTIAPIAAIFACRMLGLFMLIPVFTLYATQLQHATPVLIGLALGCYGLSQGLMQIPFGLLSDYYGRKRIITIGLILFACGSLLGALTHSIWGMILARSIQGLGAIGSVLIALLADLTPDKYRTFSMAILGASIALSFGLAFILSPLLTEYAGLAGIFYFTLGLIGIALLLLYTVIPNPKPLPQDTTPIGQRIRQVIRQPALQRLNLGIFCQHFMFTASFFFIPLRLKEVATWHMYLPLLTASFIIMALLVYYSEKIHQTQRLFMGMIITTALCQLGLLTNTDSWWVFNTLLLLYFIAFNVLEAMLPSLISKRAQATNKGTAMGIYSSCQFLGIFAGGSVAGLLYQYGGAAYICLANMLIALLWFSNCRRDSDSL